VLRNFDDSEGNNDTVSVCFRNSSDMGVRPDVQSVKGWWSEKILAL